MLYQILQALLIKTNDVDRAVTENARNKALQDRDSNGFWCDDRANTICVWDSIGFSYQLIPGCFEELACFITISRYLGLWLHDVINGSPAVSSEFFDSFNQQMEYCS